MQAIQSGTIAFIQQLRKRKCGDASEAVLLLSGDQFTIEYLQEHGFTKPVLVECKDGLGIVVPHSSFTVADVEKHVGEYVCMYVCTYVCMYMFYCCCIYSSQLQYSNCSACPTGLSFCITLLMCKPYNMYMVEQLH